MEFMEFLCQKDLTAQVAHTEKWVCFEIMHSYSHVDFITFG
jgi:hypothetical protein